MGLRGPAPKPTGVRVLEGCRAHRPLAEDEALLAEAYAGLWKMIRAVEDKAKKEGKELPGGPLFALVSMTSGRLAMNAIRDLGARVLVERREFGLTSSSRTRISAPEDGSMDALDMKLCG